MGIDLNVRLLQQADARTQKGGGAASPAAPESGAQERFETALHRKDGEDKGSGQHDGGSRDGGERTADRQKEATSLPSATELMQNLFAGRLQSNMPVAGAQEAAPVAAPQDMDSLVSTLVERILVSEPGKGNPEVRMTLGDGPLKGTELSLVRAHDGQLTVHLSCANAAAFQTAVGAQHELRAMLERSNDAVRVAVTQQNGTRDHGENSRRQSRGLEYMSTDDA